MKGGLGVQIRTDREAKTKLKAHKYRDDTKFQGDYRFRDYVSALRDQDIATCQRLREEWVYDQELLTKFDTAEKVMKRHKII